VHRSQSKLPGLVQETKGQSKAAPTCRKGRKEGRKEGWMDEWMDVWMDVWMDEVWTEKNSSSLFFSLYSYPIANHRLWLAMY
jgi:hypothetical protein